MQGISEQVSFQQFLEAMFELEKWLTDEDKAVIEASERKKTPKDTEQN